MRHQFRRSGGISPEDSNNQIVNIYALILAGVATSCAPYAGARRHHAHQGGRESQWMNARRVVARRRRCAACERMKRRTEALYRCHVSLNVADVLPSVAVYDARSRN